MTMLMIGCGGSMGRLARTYRRSNMPLYLQVASTLRRRIQTGHWAPGEQISTIEALEREFEVARVTIRQAVALLQREGMVLRRQGKGTFVTDNIPDKRWLRLEIGLSALLDSIVENVPEFLKVASPPPRPRLNAGDGELDGEYVYLKSVQSRDRQPFGVVSVHLAKRIFDLAPDRFAAKAALPILSELDGVTIGRAHQTMVIGAADTEIAELLQIELNAPTAEATCVVVDDQGIAIYVAEIVYRGDCIKFHIELTPRPPRP